ncbi:MAG: hypothetical protein V8Q93_15815 [Blautia faecis]
MEKKQGFLKKFLVVMIAVFSLTLLSPEVATQLGTMQTVQAAVKISSKSLIMVKGQKKTLKHKRDERKKQNGAVVKNLWQLYLLRVWLLARKGITVITQRLEVKSTLAKSLLKRQSSIKSLLQ